MTTNYAITHAGCYHADDIMGAIILRMLYPNMKIKRVDNPSEITDAEFEDVIIFDIGGGRFDHHQFSIEAENAACGLLWNEFGRDIIRETLTEDEVILESVFMQFQEYLRPLEWVDIHGPATDHGDHYLNLMVRDMSANRIPFDFCVEHLEPFIHSRLQSIYDMEVKKITARRWANECTDGVLDITRKSMYIPAYMFKDMAIDYTISNNPRGGYNLQSVDIPLPKGELEGVTFRSFMLVFDTFENALNAAKIGQNQYKQA